MPKAKCSKMKFLSEDTIEYMNRVWGFNGSEESDDMAMFWECAEYEMVAKRLVEAGAVEPNCKEAKDMIKVAKSISDNQASAIVDSCLEHYTVVECSECNAVKFVSYFNDISDWTEGHCSSCYSKGTVKEIKHD